MSIAIGLDFGSLGFRAAYVLDEEIISVPMPPDEAARGLIFMNPDPNAPPLGLSFSSLKYELGTNRPFNWQGASRLPEDAVKDIFVNIKRAVETYAGEEIGRAVIAVPAQYSTQRRAIVRELGVAAGLGAVDLINDCTAAALGHTYGQESKSQTLLLYSMGFIGFEIGVLRFARQHLRELAHEGAKSPAGRDFDTLTMTAVIDSLHRQGFDLPLKVFTSHWFDFRYLASDVKERLSVEEESILSLPPYITGTDTLRIRFRREIFEQAIARSVEATLTVVDRALEDTNVQAKDVDQVLLVGGSTRIGLVQRRLEEQFGGKVAPPRDDLIARGAAVQAHRAGKREGDTQEFRLPSTDQLKPTPPPPSEPPPAALPLAPDLEPLWAYARQLADRGQRETAIEFLQQLAQQSQALKEQLSEP